MKHRSRKTPNDLIQHFQRRSLERLGFILSQKKLKLLLDEHRLTVMGRQSNTRTLFRLRKEVYGDPSLNEDAVLVYDRLRHTFTTVMPFEGWLENHDEEGRRIR